MLFRSGDAVYYTPEKGSVTTVDSAGQSVVQEYVISSIFDEGLYFVKRIDEKNIKLARSRSNIYNNIFAKANTEGNDTKTIQNNLIEKYDIRRKSHWETLNLRIKENTNWICLEGCGLY